MFKFVLVNVITNFAPSGLGRMIVQVLGIDCVVRNVPSVQGARSRSLDVLASGVKVSASCCVDYTCTLFSGF